MRWFVLYARSRQVPTSLVALLASTVLLGWAALASRPEGASLSTLILMSATITLSIGLSGHDVALDRTAAIPWPRRRAAHVVLIGVVTGVAFLVLESFGELAPLGLVALDCTGLIGLVALGATFFGAQLAWTAPLTWFAIALFVPQSPDTTVHIATWMLQPPGTPAATWTALVLGVTGTLTYALHGPRLPPQA